MSGGVVAREVLVEALAGKHVKDDPTDIITTALEIAASEAMAIFELGEGANDTRTLLAYGLAGRLEALRSYVASVADMESKASEATEGTP